MFTLSMSSTLVSTNQGYLQHRLKTHRSVLDTNALEQFRIHFEEK